MFGGINAWYQGEIALRAERKQVGGTRMGTSRGAVCLWGPGRKALFWPRYTQGPRGLTPLVTLSLSHQAPIWPVAPGSTHGGQYSQRSICLATEDMALLLAAGCSMWNSGEGSRDGCRQSPGSAPQPPARDNQACGPVVTPPDPPEPWDILTGLLVASRLLPAYHS